MKNVTVTYHMSTVLRPHSTAETCIDIPIKDDEADDLCHSTPTRDAEIAMVHLNKICNALAKLQGYDEAEIVDIRYAKDQR